MSQGTTRNPMMVLLISLVCAPYAIFSLFQMCGELSAYLGKPVPWWHLFIPILNLIFVFSTLPKLVQEAKSKAGAPNPAKGGIIYFLVAPYAMAADLNEVWNPKALPA